MEENAASNVVHYCHRFPLIGTL